jgi:hypothetical protein
MGCLICRDMERAIESKHAEYIEARFAPYFRVSTKLAARKKVDLERAKYELEEHKLVCVSTVKDPALIPVQAMLSFP